MLVSYVVFIVFYCEVYVVRETEQECATIAAVADAEWQRYDAGVQSLARTEDVRGALDGQTVTEAYRSLYEFSFAGPLRADFALLREDGTVCASNLYAVNSDSFARHDGIRRELLRLNRSRMRRWSSTVLLPLAYDQGGCVCLFRCCAQRGRQHGRLSRLCPADRGVPCTRHTWRRRPGRPDGPL